MDTYYPPPQRKTTKRDMMMMNDDDDDADAEDPQHHYELRLGAMAPFRRYAAFVSISQPNYRLNQVFQPEPSNNFSSVQKPSSVQLFFHQTKEDQATASATNDEIILQDGPPNPSANDESQVEDKEADGSMAFQAVFLLNLVAVIWGTQHSVIKMVVDDCDAASFSFARFGLASVLASPFIPSIGPFWKQLTTGTRNADDDSMEEGDEQNALAWRWGIEMGIWMFLGYAFQAIGLEYTTAQRAGFLLYLNVKFVPFFARILFGRQISITTWASAFTALVGTALISFDGKSLDPNIGDAWSIAAAAASAMFILRLEAATNAVKNSAALSSISIWIVTIIAFFWCIGSGLHDQLGLTNADATSLPASARIFSSAVQATTSNVLETITSHPIELIYLGGVTTALANYIQTKAQRGISAERASIIYALDPVYGE